MSSTSSNSQAAKISGTAKVSRCERYCFKFSLFYLQIINLVDFFLGIFFLIFTLYLVSALGKYYTNIHVAWLAFCTLLIGVLLMLTACLSFCAISSTNYRSMAFPTDILAFLVVLIDFALGVASMKLHPVIESYLDNHGSEIGLSSYDVQTLKNWYLVIALGFFVSLFLEILRLWLNRGFSYTSRRIDMEYATLLDDENREWEEKMQTARQTTQEKYRKLKEHYHQKYNKPIDAPEEIF
jgi:hypothetical protein